MSSTNFVDGQTVIFASWLNDVDDFVYREGPKYASLGIILSLGALVDNTPSIQAALATYDQVYLADTVEYGISSKIILNTNKKLFGPGTLRPLTGFSDRMAVQIDGSNARLEVDYINGNNMNSPTSAWTGGGVGIARSPIGCAVFVNGSVASPLSGVVISGKLYQNFPSGPICSFNAPGIVVRIERCINNQTYTAFETNGVIQLQESHGGRVFDGFIQTFNWKGVNFGNSNDTIAINVRTNIGRTGQAAFYVNGGSRSGFINCAHEGGGGDSHKAFQSTDTFVYNFTSLDSTGVGVYFDSCNGSIANGIFVRDPASYGVHITGVTAPALATTIDNYKLSRTVAGTTLNHRAIFMLPSAGFPVNTVNIGQGVIENWFQGIAGGSTTANHQLTKVSISSECQITGTVQDDIFLYTDDVEVKCKITRTLDSTSNTNIFLHTNSSFPGKILDVSGVEIEGIGTGDRLIEINGVWDHVIARNIKTRGGGTSLRTVTGSTIKNLTIDGIEGWDAAQINAVDLNFSTGITTLVHVNNVKLPISAGGYRSLTFTLTGGSALSGFVSDAMPGLAVNGGTNRPRTVMPFRGTGSPETVVTAPVGSIYNRTDGGAATTLYVKESGIGNTGWVGK